LTSLIAVFLAFLGAGCGGGSAGDGQEKASEGATTPQPASEKKGPPAPERVEGLAVGEQAVLGGGSVAVTLDAAYKVTPREGEFTPSKGGPNWSFFRNLQREGQPALLFAVTVASEANTKAEAGTNADPNFNTTSFRVNDENGYTLPQIPTPAELDSQHPSQGWQGVVAPGQARGATIGKSVPIGQDAGLTTTYQFSGDPRTPRATWDLGDLQALPEAPIP